MLGSNFSRLSTKGLNKMRYFLHKNRFFLSVIFHLNLNLGLTRTIPMMIMIIMLQKLLSQGLVISRISSRTIFQTFAIASQFFIQLRAASQYGVTKILRRSLNISISGRGSFQNKSNFITT